MKYADYSFYKDIFNGKISEAEFNSAIIESSQFLRYITLQRSDAFTGAELSYAACAVADLYASGCGNEVLVTGENTDGYSVSYTAQGTQGETAEQLLERKAYAVAKKWLAGTGLLSRRVVHVR